MSAQIDINRAVREIEQGNQRAFAKIYELYKDEFVGLMRNKYRIATDVIYDVYQDACAALYDNIISHRYTQNNNASLKTYLFRIGHNKLVDYIRRNKENFQFIDQLNYDDSDASAFAYEQSERFAIVNRVVEELTEPCKSILTLYYWERKSMKEIAKMMDFSGSDSAKTQKRKCMSKLSVYIKKLLG